MITLTGLTKRYGERTVVRDLSATILPGRVTGFLGNISFGLYVYHFFVIRAILHVFQDIGYTAVGHPLVYEIVLYSLTLVLSIVIAGLSYRFFETRAE